MKSVVFFDVDNVLIRGQSQVSLVRFLFKNRHVNFIFLIKIIFWFFLYKLNLVKNTVRVREHALSVFRGWKLNYSKDFFERFYDIEIKPILIAESVRIIKSYQEEGSVIVLLSASINEIIEQIAKHLDIEHVIATNLEVIDGVYTGKTIGEVPYGNLKKVLAQDFIIKKGFKDCQTVAYSDHITDKFLLEFVQNPFVVNPDKSLKGLAITNSWPILYLK
jgi:HAD superfamily hydrolase (TIGR01490 family)